jgi:uncharacterized membrane protein YedE/YeeE
LTGFAEQEGSSTKRGVDGGELVTIVVVVTVTTMAMMTTVAMAVMVSSLSAVDCTYDIVNCILPSVFSNVYLW